VPLRPVTTVVQSAAVSAFKHVQAIAVLDE